MKKIIIFTLICLGACADKSFAYLEKYFLRADSYVLKYKSDDTLFMDILNRRDMEAISGLIRQGRLKHITSRTEVNVVSREAYKVYIINSWQTFDGCSWQIRFPGQTDIWYARVDLFMEDAEGYSFKFNSVTGNYARDETRKSNYDAVATYEYVDESLPTIKKKNTSRDSDLEADISPKSIMHSNAERSL